jgi:NTE family protein
MSARPAMAFVFAGGSSLGCIQVGMLKALVKRGIVPDFVVGSSAGAINAVHFASDPTVSGVAQLESIWCSLKRDDIFPVSRLGGLLRLLRQRSYLVESTGLSRLLESRLALRDLAATRIPCHVVTTDLLQGTEFRVHTGPAIPALLASAAIPGIFPAVRLHGRYLIDGGVANHTPISAALDLGAEIIYVLPTGYSCELKAPPRNAIGVALHGLNILIARQLVTDVRQLGARGDIRVVPPLCPLGVAPYDFAAGQGLIERAESSTLDWLDHGTEMVDGVPHALPPHSHEDDERPYGPHVH